MCCKYSSTAAQNFKLPFRLLVSRGTEETASNCVDILEMVCDDGEAEAGLSRPVVERGGEQVLREVVVQVVAVVEQRQG